MYHHHQLRYNPDRVLASAGSLLHLNPRRLPRFPNNISFTGIGCQPIAQPSSWRASPLDLYPPGRVVRLYPRTLGSSGTSGALLPALTL
jgi:hypothetical protein